MILYRKVKGDPQRRFYTVKCDYCGKLFIKFHSATKYCSDKCRNYSNLEHTEERVRKHRRKHRSKTDDYWGLGSGYLHGTPKTDWREEHKAIQTEQRRLKLIPAK